MRQEAQGEPTVTKIANTYDLWRSLIAEKHLPEDVAKDVKHELKAIDRAQEHYLETVARSHTIALEHSTTRQQAPTIIATELHTTSKPTTTKLAGDLVMLEQAKTEAEVAARLAKTALEKCRSIVDGTLFTRHRDSLITYVAQRRAEDLGAFGYSERLTRDLDALWLKIRPNLYPLDVEEMSLPIDFSRLPLIMEPRWDRKARGSLAWIWQQIAEGSWRWSPPRGNTEAPPTLLRITTLFDKAPTVPPSPKEKSDRLWRIGFAN